MKGKIALLLCFLVFFSANASAYAIERHLIEISIAADGDSKVKEKFFFVFRNAADLANFRAKALENGSSMEEWEIFDGNIATHIDGVKSGTGRISFGDRDKEKFVELEYEPKNPVVMVKSESSRKTNWIINSSVFRAFEAGSVYAIPANVDIAVLLPKNAEIETETIVPSAVVSGNLVSWSGPINVSGNITLNYSTEKQIAPAISISKTMQELLSGKTLPAAAAIIIIVLVLFYWKRNFISKKIEAYIVEHSKIESKPGKEEDEID